MYKQPKVVIKVENETGDEIITVTLSVDMAGHFLEYLGTQLRPPMRTAPAMPPPVVKL